MLRQPSTSVPVRHHKLLTMAPQTKVSKRNINLQKKEHDQITKCLRQRLAWCNRTGQTYDPSVEQYSTIIDGMFLINCNPLRSISNISEYAMLLFKWFIAPHFNAGATEVHLVFDTKNRQQFNPKCFEHERRDVGKSPDNNEHITFTPSTKVPQTWQTFIECRKCKQSIV